MSLLVVMAWAQLGMQGQLGGRAIGGGVAAVALYMAVDRLAPAPLAVVPAVLVPGAAAVLTGAGASNIGWFVLAVLAGLMAFTLPLRPGLTGWFMAVIGFVILAVTRPDGGWPNWVAGTSIAF